jgi:hypothetical protein
MRKKVEYRVPEAGVSQASVPSLNFDKRPKLKIGNIPNINIKN